MADERQPPESPPPESAPGSAVDPSDEAQQASAWRVTARIAALRAEERVNLLRALAVALLFAMEVLRHHDVIPAPLAIPSWGDATAFHGVATDLALAWSLVVAGVAIALRNRAFPRALPYATTAADLVCVTALVVIGDGAQSAFVRLYFAIVALSTLRLEPWLVHFATAGSIVSYLSVVALVERAQPALAVPRHQSVLFVLAIAVVGLALAYATHEVRRVAQEYAARVRGSAR